MCKLADDLEGQLLGADLTGRPDCICIFQTAAYHFGAAIQSGGND
jgi:hypothetical protein